MNGHGNETITQHAARYAVAVQHIHNTIHTPHTHTCTHTHAHTHAHTHTHTHTHATSTGPTVCAVEYDLCPECLVYTLT